MTNREYNEKRLKDATINTATECRCYAEELERHFREMNDKGWRLLTISVSKGDWATCFWERANET